MKFEKTFLFLVALLAACNGGPGSPGPVPTPGPTPTPIQLASRPFEVRPNIYGFSAPGPPAPRDGILEFVARWDPVPPAGQVYLFLMGSETTPQDLYSCYDAHDNFSCPQILARAMGQEHPKRIKHNLKAGEWVYFWVVGVEGSVSGFVEIYLLP